MADRLREMRAFVAVCDAKGFAPAARRTGIAASVVTRLIGGLELDLGVVLLQRTTRSIKLTDAGARFLERSRRILADVEEAELAAQEERGLPRGRLTVSAPLIFGRIHVAPLVLDLLQEHPGLQVELNLSDRYVNLVEEGVDVAVRIGHLSDSALIARRIGATRRVLVASPKYLQSRGIPTEPEHLASHSLIAFDTLGPNREWRFDHPERGGVRVPLHPRFSTNSGEGAIEHALRGGGITAVFRYQVSSAIAEGRLVELLDKFAPPEVPIQAVFPTTRLLSIKVRALLNAFEVRQFQWQDQP
jgi:DNA-binding transcriptional LysR family regulator